MRSKDADRQVIPTDTVYVTIDKEAVKKSGMMMASDTIPDKMVISLAGKRALYKQDMMMLEMIAECGWVRPIYIAMTVGSDNYMNLGDNFVCEGLANRITPFTTNKPGVKNFDTEKTYNNLMNRYKFGGLEKPGLYIDETTMGMCMTHRRLFAQLVTELLKEGKTEQAKKALAKAEKVLPEYNVPHSWKSGSIELARAYALLGQTAKAKDICLKLWKNHKQYAQWYLSLDDFRFMASQNQCLLYFQLMMEVNKVTTLFDKNLAKKQLDELNRFYTIYAQKGGKPLE